MFAMCMVVTDPSRLGRSYSVVSITMSARRRPEVILAANRVPTPIGPSVTALRAQPGPVGAPPLAVRRPVQRLLHEPQVQRPVAAGRLGHVAEPSRVWAPAGTSSDSALPSPPARPSARPPAHRLHWAT